MTDYHFKHRARDNVHFHSNLLCEIWTLTHLLDRNIIQRTLFVAFHTTKSCIMNMNFLEFQ